MKYEIYKQMPILPATGIDPSGTDTFTLSPSTIQNSVSRIKSVYIDLPSGVTLNINLSTLGGGQDDINSPGNEAGSIVFRTGVEFNKDITITVTGSAGTAYGLKIVTEVETVAVTSQAGLGWLIMLGLIAGTIYVARKKEKEKILPKLPKLELKPPK